jgi:diacylglycerol kinase
MDTITPKEREMFSVIKRAKSFTHAWRGLVVFIKTTHNAWIHLTVFVCALIAGFYFHLNRYEWIALIFAAGLVLMAEAFNTAIEIDIDLTSPDYHPFARDTKDVAAGAVLIASVTAAVVGILIFAPHILQGSTY